MKVLSSWEWSISCWMRIVWNFKSIWVVCVWKRSILGFWEWFWVYWVVFSCVTAVFDMQYWEAEIWITAEYMKTSFASSFFAVDTMSMSESSKKRRSTLLLREAARRFIFRSATIFPGRKHLRENVLLFFRSEMLIRKWLLPEPNIQNIAMKESKFMI